MFWGTSEHFLWLLWWNLFSLWSWSYSKITPNWWALFPTWRTRNSLIILSSLATRLTYFRLTLRIGSGWIVSLHNSCLLITYFCSPWSMLTYGALRNSQVVLQLLFQLTGREAVKLVECILKSFSALLVKKENWFPQLWTIASRNCCWLGRPW